MPLKVTTPSTSEDLTTLTTVKADLQITDTSRDEDLQRYISDASADCASYCNTTFGQAGYQETFPTGSDGTDTLVLARRPIVAIASVTEGGRDLVLDTDFAVDEENGILYRLPQATGWSWTHGGRSGGWSPIVVDYTAGYDLPDSPPRDIGRACLAMIREFWFGAARDPTMQRISIPGVLDQGFSTARDPSTDPTLPKAVTDRLDRYKRVASLNA